MFHKSVKFRLTLWYALVLSVVLSAFSFWMYMEFARILHRDADNSLTAETIIIEESMDSYLKGIFRGVQIAQEKKVPIFIPSAYTPEVRVRLHEVIDAWQKSSEQLTTSTKIIRFVGIDKSEFYSNLKGWETKVIFPDFERNSVFMETGESFQTIYFNNKPIRLYYHLVKHQDQSLFVIQSGVPIFEVVHVLNRLAFIILVSIPGTVLVACIAGLFLARRSFRPIDLMIRDARKITAAYLKGRLPRSGTGDELDRLAETLNEMMDRLEVSTRAIQDFSSDISHELKTPLAIVRGEIDLALRRERSPESLKATLGVIAEEVNGLIRLVDDLLLLVRSDAKQLNYEQNVVSLDQVANYVFSRFQDRAIEKGLELAIDAEEGLEVLGDSVYLKRLLSNLLDNAIKFTPKEGKVSVHLKREGDMAYLEVSDTGIGIDIHMQEKVFSRFYRTDQARCEEGSGLGLNIAKAICDAHRAQIKVISGVTQGTRVLVWFPIHHSV